MSVGRRGAVERPLLGALLFSVAAHLLVLMAGGGQMASVVEASGVAGKKLQALSVSVSGARISAVVRQPMPQGRQTAPRPAGHPSSVLAIAGAAPARFATVAESAQSDALPPISAVVETVAPSASIAVVPDKADMSGREPALPAGYLDAVRGYRIALASQARRFRVYPPVAREMGIGGRSEIEVVVAASSLPQLRLRESSGHEELDRAALEMLRRSVEYVELPVLLKGRTLSISLPVEFLPPP